MIAPRHVISLRGLGLGDILTAIPSLRALLEAYPAARHVLAAPSEFRVLLAMADLEKVEVVDAHGPVLPMGRLPPGSLAVNLHGKGPESHRALLSGRPESLIAFASGEVGHSGPRWRREEHEVERWCRLLAESGIPADPSRLSIDSPDIGLPGDTVGATVIHPGAKAPARRWPLTRWADIVRELTRGGTQIVVTGSESERPAALELARMAGIATEQVWAGRTDLATLAAIVGRSRLVISGDTGVAHLASATGTPSIVLFGPTDPAQWGPPVGPHRVLWKGVTGDPHADTPHEGLLQITPEEVLAAVSETFAHS